MSTSKVRTMEESLGFGEDRCTKPVRRLSFFLDHNFPQLKSIRVFPTRFYLSYLGMKVRENQKKKKKNSCLFAPTDDRHLAHLVSPFSIVSTKLCHTRMTAQPIKKKKSGNPIERISMTGMHEPKPM